MPKNRDSLPGWRKAVVGLAAAAIAAAAGWGSGHVAFPSRPTPACIQINGPANQQPVYFDMPRRAAAGTSSGLSRPLPGGRSPHVTSPRQEDAADRGASAL